MTIAQVIAAIPDVVWSGLIASALALAGVLVSNRSTTKRLASQLEHDAQENRGERLSQMRREVYLAAAEASVRLNGYFGSLPQVDFKKPDASAPLTDMLAIGAKVQLLVDQRTAKILADLIAMYAELQFMLMPGAAEPSAQSEPGECDRGDAPSSRCARARSTARWRK